MTRRLRIEGEAREDLASAIAWYEKQCPGLGGEFLDAIDEAVAQLLDDPGVSTPVPSALIPGCPPDLPARRVFVKRFPYAVVFMESGDDVQVIAVAHLRRLPGYWKSRTMR